MYQINDIELLGRLKQLGEIGKDDRGLSRVAFTTEDKLGRDQFVHWLKALGLTVKIDQIGNIFGVWEVESDIAPIMMGSHIDSVINAGIYDGCYGVLAGLSVIEALKVQGFTPDRSIIVAAFSNEEGVRYAPDMMGSLVYAGGLDIDDALNITGIDDTRLGDELTKIGYAGDMKVGSIVPSAYLELHVEQGPILEAENKQIGVVANLQGISWQQVEIKGVANHAGTTPTYLRKDAGLTAAKIICELRKMVEDSNSVATVGTIEFKPNAINVIPDYAKFTIDMRDPDEVRLKSLEDQLDTLLEKLAAADQVFITKERLARFEPVIFDKTIVETISNLADKNGYAWREMTSGAGHDAQMMARICPSAMIFVPSKDGISHNPKEHTDDVALIMGANLLCETIVKLTS